MPTAFPERFPMRRPVRVRRPMLEAVEPRLLLHGGHDHGDGVNMPEVVPTGVNQRPLSPIIIEPLRNGQIVSGSDVHMETAPMRDPDAGDVHVSSDFQIWLARPRRLVWVANNVDGLEKAHSHLGDGRFVGPFVGRTSLAANRTYQFRIRHRDSSGDPATEWSPWSVRTFRTARLTQPGGGGVGAPGQVQNGWRVMQSGFQVEVVGQGYQLPVNIAFAATAGGDPAEPSYYVSELYGTIKVVRNDGKISTYAANLLNFDPTGRFPGSGEQGLTGVAVDPTTGDLFAALLYDDGTGAHHPKVIRLTSDDGGFTGSTITTVLDISSEVQGPSHQISHVSIGPDGMLYVHMGDGMAPAVARDLDQFRGKILRLNTDGSAPADNPYYDAADGIAARDYVYASGFRNPFGGAWRGADKRLYEVENGPSVDRLAQVARGADYGWDGSNASMRNRALYNWDPAVAPVKIVFVQPSTFGGSGFPGGKQDRAFVTESGPTYATGPQQRGKRVVEFALAADGRVERGPIPLLQYAGRGKATAVALAAGPDGLYFSELYPDQGGDPTASGARILRIRSTGR